MKAFIWKQKFQQANYRIIQDLLPVKQCDIYYFHNWDILSPQDTAEISEIALQTLNEDMKGLDF
jgi:hypothetical protein